MIGDVMMSIWKTGTKIAFIIDIFGNKKFGNNGNVFSGSYHQNIDGKPYFSTGCSYHFK
jgi:hypothetical protein